MSASLANRHRDVVAAAMTRFTERTLAIDCAGEQMAGILCLPEAPPKVAVVVVVGGPQYRAGSHRQFVLLARALAQAGFAVLRFDCRGMGDSGGEPRNFESISDDIGCALKALRAALPQVQRCVLWGLCDGASAALMYVDRGGDHSVAGLCLVNPWVRTGASQARTQVKHYYTRRVLEREFWLKLLSGRVAAGALRELVRSVVNALRGAPGGTGKTASGADARAYPQRMADGWRRFDGPLLLILSGNDYTAKEFIELVAIDTHWQGALNQPKVQRCDLPEADHTFSSSGSQQSAEALTVDWLRRFGAEAA
jgi:exosortase A-associated hydrolase 1